MTRKANFTPTGIDALRAGKLADPHTHGLFVAVLRTGKKAWKYRRRITGTESIVERSFGHYPAITIAQARAWATSLNEQVEAGVDPRDAEKLEVDRARMTIAHAHGLYMAAVREGRASRASRANKPRTIGDKLAIYRCDIAPTLGKTLIYDVTEEDLTKLVLAKGKRARVRANRLAAELKVFFGWAASLRGLEIGLTCNPAARLGDLKFPEKPRERFLTLEEISWFLRAVALEERIYQRGLLLWLLSAARLSEVINARSDEFRDGIWTIKGERVKNAVCHRIALGPWGRSLILSNHEWVFPSERIEGPRVPCGWYKARNRVLARMSEFAGHAVPQWTPHDLRRTARSNTKRLNVDYETAEAMLNHRKKGLERTYDGYQLENEKRAWFLKWEEEIVRIARHAGVAELLQVPSPPSTICEAPALRMQIRYATVTTTPGCPSRSSLRIA